MSADDAGSWSSDGPKHTYTHTSSWQRPTAFQNTNKTKTDEEQAFFTDFHSYTHSNVVLQSDMWEKFEKYDYIFFPLGTQPLTNSV